jgi:hypothetical protein
VPDKYLCGNGLDCPACQLRRDADRDFFWGARNPKKHKCNSCHGDGRIARKTKDIIADHVAEAAPFYWKPKTKEDA